jgi:hypothetical protein
MNDAERTETLARLLINFCFYVWIFYLISLINDVLPARPEIKFEWEDAGFVLVTYIIAWGAGFMSGRKDVQK